MSVKKEHQVQNVLSDFRVVRSHYKLMCSVYHLYNHTGYFCKPSEAGTLVNVKSAYKLRGPSTQHLSLFSCSRKSLGVFLCPLGCDASPSQGYPPVLNSLVTVHLPGWKQEL